MADPIISEQSIIGLLDVPASLEAADRLQSGAMLALVDGFDRRIQREPFVRLTAAAMSTHTNLGRLQFLNLIVELAKKQPLTADQLTQAVIEIVAYCETERLSLLHQAKLVAMCPVSTDKIS
jgi:hypothetical protein